MKPFKRMLWVIEGNLGDGWFATIEAYITREEARRELGNLMATRLNRKDRYRAVKYAPEKIGRKS